MSCQVKSRQGEGSSGGVRIETSNAMSGQGKARQGELWRSARAWFVACSGRVRGVGVCPATRARGEAALTRELDWAGHLSLPAVLLPELPAEVAPIARLLQEHLQRATSWRAT